MPKKVPDIFTRKRILQTCECDRYGNVRPLILMNELQGIADTHAELAGCGRTFLREHNMAWVVTHYLVDILELPREAEELTVSTWAAENDGLHITRDFELRGKDKRLLVRATSQWILINMENRFPLRLKNYMSDWQLVPRRAWSRSFEKFPDFKPTKTCSMKCRFDDIDVNQHINNAVYAVWATESVGYDYRNQHKLRQIGINFIKEIPPTSPDITIEVAINDLQSFHKIKTGDNVHARIICVWENN